MATSHIDKVLTVFEGIRRRDPGLTTRYMNSTKYMQHNPHAADGVEGLKEYVRSLPEQGHRLEVIRTYRDGDYVFTQEEGAILGQGVFFDLFRFEDNQIVEHWVFSGEAALPNASGHTQTNGPVEVNQNEDTEKNKAIVRDYYETVHIAGDRGKIPQYFSGDHCIRHEPGISGDGVAAFERDLESAIQVGRKIEGIRILLGQGDYVFVAARGSLAGQLLAFVDIYRLEDGKLAEHWGLIDKLPPPEKRKNGNGML